MYTCIHIYTYTLKNLDTATHCNKLQHTGEHCKTRQHTGFRTHPGSVHHVVVERLHIATLCNTTHYACAPKVFTMLAVAAHCNKLQHTAIHCTILEFNSTHCNTHKPGQCWQCRRWQWLHTAIHCNTLPHTATYWSLLQHTATRMYLGSVDNVVAGKGCSIRTTT